MNETREQHGYETPEVLDLGAAETLTEFNPLAPNPENLGDSYRRG